MAEATDSQNSDWAPLFCADSPWHRGPLITREEELPLAPSPYLRRASIDTKGLMKISPPQVKEGSPRKREARPPQLAVLKKGMVCGFKEQPHLSVTGAWPTPDVDCWISGWHF